MSGDHNQYQKERSYLDDRNDIIRMAHKAGFEGFGNGDWVCTTEEIERFAALVAASEREECARVCDAWSKRPDDVGGYGAAAIRARGQA